MNKFEKPELEIILFEGDLAADGDIIDNSNEWGGDIGGGGNDTQVP